MPLHTTSGPAVVRKRKKRRKKGGEIVTLGCIKRKGKALLEWKGEREASLVSP